MEVGYRLIPMVDFQQDGELLGRIRSIRKKFAQEMGFLPPVVHIRDNMDLQPARYRILMKGVEMGVVMLIRGAGWQLIQALPPEHYLVKRPLIRHLA